jgi:hypothetical protein
MRPGVVSALCCAVTLGLAGGALAFYDINVAGTGPRTTCTNSQGMLVAHHFGAYSNEYKFSGSCSTESGESGDASVSNTPSYVIGAWWDGKNATEEMKLTLKDGTGEIKIVASCAADPWVNDVACTVLQRSFTPESLIGALPEAQYPISRALLTPDQRASLKAEAAKVAAVARSIGETMAKAKEAQSAQSAKPVAPLFGPPAGKVDALQSVAILLPKQGLTYPSTGPVPVKAKLPAISSETKVVLRFQRQTPQGWVTKTVVAGYDSAVKPDGISVPFWQFGQKGSWRVRVRLATPANSPWSEWVQFSIL